MSLKTDRNFDWLIFDFVLRFAQLFFNKPAFWIFCCYIAINEFDRVQICLTLWFESIIHRSVLVPYHHVNVRRSSCLKFDTPVIVNDWICAERTIYSVEHIIEKMTNTIFKISSRSHWITSKQFYLLISIHTCSFFFCNNSFFQDLHQ